MLEQPKTFLITLERDLAFTLSPPSLVEVNQDGQVRYRAGGAEPEVLTTSIPAAEARELYDALRNAGYWTLADRYVEEGESCPLRATDFRTSRWRVVADDMKNVERYEGCLQALDGPMDFFVPIPELVALDELVPRLQRLIGRDASTSASL